jgi:hypothetical protein
MAHLELNLVDAQTKHTSLCPTSARVSARSRLARVDELFRSPPWVHKTAPRTNAMSVVNGAIKDGICVGGVSDESVTSSNAHDGRPLYRCQTVQAPPAAIASCAHGSAASSRHRPQDCRPAAASSGGSMAADARQTNSLAAAAAPARLEVRADKERHSGLPGQSLP